MPRYRVHRMKDTPRENFRWSPHTGGVAIVKLKDYEPGEEVEAPTPYALWKNLAAEGKPLHPGDVLATSVLVDGDAEELQIVKYIGFEPAKWYVPEAKPEINLPAAEVAEPPSLEQLTSSPA